MRCSRTVLRPPPRPGHSDRGALADLRSPSMWVLEMRASPPELYGQHAGTRIRRTTSPARHRVPEGAPELPGYVADHRGRVLVSPALRVKGYRSESLST